MDINKQTELKKIKGWSDEDKLIIFLSDKGSFANQESWCEIELVETEKGKFIMYRSHYGKEKKDYLGEMEIYNSLSDIIDELESFKEERDYVAKNLNAELLEVIKKLIIKSDH